MTAQPSYLAASLSVAAGGAVGAWLRFAAGRLIGASPFPHATLTVNVLGSLAMGLLAGVISARSTGTGRDVDVSLFDVSLHNLCYLATWYLNAGVMTRREPRSSHPSLTPSQLYKTQDGWLFVMCNKEKFWGLFAQALGKPEWATDARFTSNSLRVRNRAELIPLLEAVFKTRTKTTARFSHTLRNRTDLAT